jgi:hypothetical protein
LIDLDLARRRLRALYRHDRRGRLKAINEWSGGRPPRFHLMRTGAGVLCRFRDDLEEGLAAGLKVIAGRERPVLTEIPTLLDRYLETLDATEFWAGPAFVFPLVLPVETGAVEIGPGNVDLLRGGLERWIPDVGRRGPFLAIVEAGGAVALCASVRITPYVHCAGVETVPDSRGRGLASRAVAAWAARVRALDAVPFYSTNWTNHASRGVARRLGLQLAAVDLHVA